MREPPSAAQNFATAVSRRVCSSASRRGAPRGPAHRLQSISNPPRGAGRLNDDRHAELDALQMTCVIRARAGDADCVVQSAASATVDPTAAAAASRVAAEQIVVRARTPVSVIAKSGSPVEERCAVSATPAAFDRRKIATPRRSSRTERAQRAAAERFFAVQDQVLLSRRARVAVATSSEPASTSAALRIASPSRAPSQRSRCASLPKRAIGRPSSTATRARNRRHRAADLLEQRADRGCRGPAALRLGNRDAEQVRLGVVFQSAVDAVRRRRAAFSRSRVALPRMPRARSRIVF
jgi:hypothetical protein